MITILYGIKGYPHHFLTDKNTLYQESHCPNKRTLLGHEIKLLRNGRSLGYMVYGKFIAHSTLWNSRYECQKRIKSLESQLPF